LAMVLCGGLAGFVGINEIMGSSHRIMLNFQAGIGFTGIAVSLIGRNHPLGIFLAALLFGILFQGGAELSFEVQAIDRHLVVLIQGLVILFAGALEHLFRTQIEQLVRSLTKIEKTELAVSTGINN
nr:ABC transporter permease [Candidatus Poribacteria bacterium]